MITCTYTQSLDYEVMDSELFVKGQKEKSGNVSCFTIAYHQRVHSDQTFIHNCYSFDVMVFDTHTFTLGLGRYQFTF